MKRGGLSILAAIVMAAMHCAAAWAEPMPVESVNPADGGVYSPTASGIGFEVKSPVLHMHTIILEVATQNVPGQDGTLADDFRVDYNLGSESDAYPGTYRVGSRGTWPSRPGTYYWQVRGTCSYYGTHCSAANQPDQYGVAPDKIFVSPVFTITIQAPQPQPKQPSTQDRTGGQYPLSRDTATRKVKAYVKRKRRGHRIKASCTRDDIDQFTCEVVYLTPKNKKRRSEIQVYRSGRNTYQYF